MGARRLGPEIVGWRRQSSLELKSITLFAAERSPRVPIAGSADCRSQSRDCCMQPSLRARVQEKPRARGGTRSRYLREVEEVGWGERDRLALARGVGIMMQRWRARALHPRISRATRHWPADQTTPPSPPRALSRSSAYNSRRAIPLLLRFCSQLLYPSEPRVMIFIFLAFRCGFLLPIDRSIRQERG